MATDSLNLMAYEIDLRPAIDLSRVNDQGVYMKLMRVVTRLRFLGNIYRHSLSPADYRKIFEDMQILLQRLDKLPEAYSPETEQLRERIYEAQKVCYENGFVEEIDLRGIEPPHQFYNPDYGEVCRSMFPTLIPIYANQTELEAALN